MKKLVLLSALVIFATNLTMAGGILTNTNQSAQFVRMLSRNATTDLDAVYFNPAGLVKMDDGFYLAYHNQSIFQTKTVNNLFPLLNNATYVGDVAVPIYPTFFANYKKEKLAISFGFGPNAGGGSAKYKTGLPSFETSISQIPLLISSMGVPTSNYSADLYFEGSSIFWGFQLGASYAFNDMISGSLGFRFIDAINTYDGHINDIMINPRHPLINPSGGFMPASTFFTAVGNTNYAARTADKKVEVKQKGVGFTPIISVNITPVKELNIAMKYEFNTKLELENETTTDGTGLFPDGDKFRNDIPAIFTAGVDYKILPDFKLSTSFNYYFDKSSNRDGIEAAIDKNYYELAFGGQYNVSEKVAFSAGIMHSETGVGTGYQTDLSYSLSSNTVGLGGEFKISKKLTVDLGFLYTMYQDGEKEITYTGIGKFKETYDKTTTIFSVGFGYKIF